MTGRPSWGIDALLVLMVVIWGANYSVIKRCFRGDSAPALQRPAAGRRRGDVLSRDPRRAPARESGGRLSSVFYTTRAAHDARSRRSRCGSAWSATSRYQSCFAGGVGATSVSNAALIIGSTPVAIADDLGAPRPRAHRAAALDRRIVVALVGIYFVVGHGASFGGAHCDGDALVMVSVACWVAYTLGATRLIARHSPLYVTGMTMIIGAMPYALLALPQILEIRVGRREPVDVGGAGAVGVARAVSVVS